jgi:autotransporter-associated beta strand protein
MGDGGTSGTLVMNGFSQTFSDLGNHNGNTGSAIINGSATASTLSVNYNGAGRTFSGTIGGTGDAGNIALIKAGTGTLTLDGSLLYSGDTSVDGGTLVLGSAALADVSNVNINGSGVLDLAHGASDTVNALFFDGIQQASGTWGATGSGAANIDDTRFAGTGVLNVTTGGVANPYDSYEVANNIVGAGPEVDSDGDSIPNGIEFVIGGVSDPGIGQNDLGLLPTISLVNADPDLDTNFEDYLLFTYRRTDAAAGVNAFGQYSFTLNNDWVEAQAGVDGVVIDETDDGFDPGVDQVDVYIPRSLSPDGRMFGRLNVDIP